MFFKDDMNVAMFELPYIFKTQPDRKPVWVLYKRRNDHGHREVGRPCPCQCHDLQQRRQMLSDTMNRGDWSTRLVFKDAFGPQVIDEVQEFTVKKLLHRLLKLVSYDFVYLPDTLFVNYGGRNPYNVLKCSWYTLFVFFSN